MFRRLSLGFLCLVIFSFGGTAAGRPACSSVVANRHFKIAIGDPFELAGPEGKIGRTRFMGIQKTETARVAFFWRAPGSPLEISQIFEVPENSIFLPAAFGGLSPAEIQPLIVVKQQLKEDCWLQSSQNAVRHLEAMDILSDEQRRRIRSILRELSDEEFMWDFKIETFLSDNQPWYRNLLPFDIRSMVPAARHRFFGQRGFVTNTTRDPGAVRTHLLTGLPAVLDIDLQLRARPDYQKLTLGLDGTSPPSPPTISYSWTPSRRPDRGHSVLAIAYLMAGDDEFAPEDRLLVLNSAAAGFSFLSMTDLKQSRAWATLFEISR
jgi:hypothetical protein